MPVASPFKKKAPYRAPGGGVGRLAPLPGTPRAVRKRAPKVASAAKRKGF